MLFYFLVTNFTITQASENSCKNFIDSYSNSLNLYKNDHKDLESYLVKVNWLSTVYVRNLKKSFSIITTNSRKDITKITKNKCKVVSFKDYNNLLLSIKYDRFTFYNIKKVSEETTLNSAEKMKVFNRLQLESVTKFTELIE